MTKGTKNDQFSPFYSVWTRPRDDDQCTQTPVKKTYTDMARAVAVAQKMAEKAPGRKFFVLTALLRVQVKNGETEVVYDPEMVQVDLGEENDDE